MYYELYLDIYFLENILLNFFVLWFSRIMTGRKKCTFRMMGAAITASMIECLILFTPIHKWKILYGILRLLILVFMVRMSVRRENRRYKVQEIGICIFARVILEGCVSVAAEYTGLPLGLCLFTGFFIACFLERYRQKEGKRRNTFYEVTVSLGDRKKQILALWDSGNQLSHPVSGKPVHIINQNIVEELLEEKEQEELRKLLRLQSVEKVSGRFSLIPYRTIGKEHGLMPVLTVDTIQIRCGENIKETKDCLVAVSQIAVSSTGKYQMILHP